MKSGRDLLAIPGFHPGYTLEAVSYTHLDVYKRQVLALGGGEQLVSLVALGALQLELLLEEAPGAVIVDDRQLGATAAGVARLGNDVGQQRPASVSYTHLDVYKRQGVDAVAQINARRSTPLPALMITANYSNELKQQMRELGHSLLHKPVRPMKLKAAMSHLMERGAGA